MMRNAKDPGSERSTLRLIGADLHPYLKEDLLGQISCILIVAQMRPESAREGDVVTLAGEIVGRHAGVSGYTIGQRQGLPASGDGARYVTRIDASTNTIVIGREDELAVAGLTASEVNLIRPERFGETPQRVLAMTRYRASLEPAVATVAGDTLRLEFESPQKAVSPGQLVALFDLNGEEVLGAATIEATS